MHGKTQSEHPAHHALHPFFDPPPRILAHRGDSEQFPENTLAAFRSAAEIGVDCIETDVHLTMDGELVIWHDDTLERSSSLSGFVEDHTLEELKKGDAGHWFSRDGGASYPFRGKGISFCSLREALTELPHMRFNVDLKTRSPRIADKFAEEIAELQAENRVLCASFHHENLQRIRAAAPGIATSFSSREVVRILMAARTGLLKLSPGLKFLRTALCRGMALQIPRKQGRITVLSPRLLRAYKKAGLYVQVWTINDGQEMRELLEMGVDGIFTDNPRLLKQTIDAFDKRNS